MNIDQIATKLLEHVNSLITKAEGDAAHYRGAADGITTLLRLIKEEAEKEGRDEPPSSKPE